MPDVSTFETYAYNDGSDRFYGSSWFTYNEGTSVAGNYIVRVSGYANFALTALPTDNSTGNLTAIYTKYSSRSGGFVKYQLVLNALSGVDF